MAGVGLARVTMNDGGNEAHVARAGHGPSHPGPASRDRHPGPSMTRAAPYDVLVAPSSRLSRSQRQMDAQHARNRGIYLAAERAEDRNARAGRPGLGGWIAARWPACAADLSRWCLVGARGSSPPQGGHTSDLAVTGYVDYDGRASGTEGVDRVYGEAFGRFSSNWDICRAMKLRLAVSPT